MNNPLTKASNFKKWIYRVLELSPTQNKRQSWIDYLRGIAIIFVVYRHVLLGIQGNGILVPDYVVKANMIFFSFRIPLFFIVSGIFINRSILKKGRRELLTIKFENLLYPYFVWSIIQISLQIALSSYTNSSRTLHDYLYIFYQPRNLDQFWYLPALFNATAIFILIKTKFSPTHLFQLTFGILLYFTSQYFREISIISDWMEFYFFFALGDTISELFLHEKTTKIFESYVTLIITIPIFSITQIYYLRHSEEFYRNSISGQAQFLIIALIGCFSMFSVAFNLQKLRLFSYLRTIGVHSLHIYVIHVLAAAFIRTIMTKVFHIYNPFILLIIGISFGIILPIIFYNTIVKESFGWFLFSFRSKRLKSPASLKTSKKN